MIDVLSFIAMQAQPPQAPVDLPGVMDNFQEELFASVVRLPLAATMSAEYWLVVVVM